MGSHAARGLPVTRMRWLHALAAGASHGQPPGRAHARPALRRCAAPRWCASPSSPRWWCWRSRGASPRPPATRPPAPTCGCPPRPATRTWWPERARASGAPRGVRRGRAAQQMRRLAPPVQICRRNLVSVSGADVWQGHIGRHGHGLNGLARRPAGLLRRGAAHSDVHEMHPRIDLTCWCATLGVYI